MVEFVAGDVLFQDIGCGAVCDAINGVTPGHRNAEINHCGVVWGSGPQMVVLEAIFPRVRKTAVADFLNRSLDDSMRPRVMVGRTVDEVRPLVPSALAFCLSCVDKAYDALFNSDDTSFYCSELIVDGFRAANGGAPIFPERPMSFRDPKTGKILAFWQRYYDALKAPIPQGMPGSNPGALSTDPHLTIIAQLGDLRGAPL